VHLDFGVEPHFLALGGTGWGKTAVLRTILRGITTAYTPAEAAVLLVDYRSALKGVLKTDHLLRYTATAADLPDMVEETVESLSHRISETFTRPDLFVVVDDYDLVARPGANPLARWPSCSRTTRRSGCTSCSHDTPRRRPIQRSTRPRWS
jgi:S-DNA-T family DNA segregation ATPase FtsK/SpoIIIE